MLKVYEWMIKTLNLKGIELIVYAVIYQETRITKEPKIILLSDFTFWANSTKRGVLLAIDRLVEKKYIYKDYVYENNIKYCTYKCTFYKD